MVDTVVQVGVPAALVLSTLLFLWGVTMYQAKSDDREVRANAEEIMFYGVVGVLAATAFWIIIRLLQSLF